MTSEQQLIASLAQRYGVDPKAALAIASVEGGFHGATGDNGTSFGPFQLHEGGALPQGRGADWANSYAGINYALQRISSVARGLHGRAAVSAISSRFERPANIPAEIAKAMGRYGGPSGNTPMGRFGSPTGMGSSNANRAAVLHFIQQLMASQQAPQLSAIPSAAPVQVSLYPTNGGT